jgi:hypothetical protein
MTAKSAKNAYHGDDCVFITIWVDDLMLFASSDEMMKHLKHSIQSEWEVTDLGEPNKIIGIEITLLAGQVTNLPEEIHQISPRKGRNG